VDGKFDAHRLKRRRPIGVSRQFHFSASVDSIMMAHAPTIRLTTR
jgi:hypothetical protein